MTIESLKSESLKLDKGTRKELAYFLLDSIFEEEEGLSLTPEQRAELDRRLEAFAEGRMEFVASETVVGRIREKHGL